MFKPSREPILKAPLKQADKPEDRAAILLIHGFGDTGPGMENIPDQFQSANKLPYTLWLLPTAPQNRDAMDTAWYLPTALHPFPPQRPELDDDEDEDGMLRSLTYLESLIAGLHATHGVPPHRIVLAGFSQGCALALLLNLVSREYAGKLGGVVGLMGYLPLGANRIAELREERGLVEEGEEGKRIETGDVMLVRGAVDRMIPARVWRLTLEGLQGLNVDLERMEVREYEGVGHGLSSPVLHDMLAFLERVIPENRAEEGETTTP